MNSYEGLFVIKPDAKEEEMKAVCKAINDSIAKSGGSIKKEEPWGKRPLAYRLKKQREGYFYKIEFDLDPAAITKIEGAYKLNPGIIRTMITRK